MTYNCGHNCLREGNWNKGTVWMSQNVICIHNAMNSDLLLHFLALLSIQMDSAGSSVQCEIIDLRQCEQYWTLVKLTGFPNTYSSVSHSNLSMSVILLRVTIQQQKTKSKNRFQSNLEIKSIMMSQSCFRLNSRALKFNHTMKIGFNSWCKHLTHQLYIGPNRV